VLLTAVLVLKAFLVLGALLALQSIVALRDGYRFLRFVRKARREPPGSYRPFAALIIPCKGIDADFDANLRCFLAQEYPSYQVIFVVASESDPACEYLRDVLKQPFASGSAPKTALIVAGYADNRGEKVNNLLRGLSAVDSAAQVLVFADADARPARDWLRSLVAPLADSKVLVSTGFRWYLPGASFVSQLRAAWDTSIATLLGDHDHNFAWGGSMAIRAADFRRLEVADRYWANTVSDDYALTRAARDARGWIRFEPRCLVASREDSSFGEFLRWSNRQIIITRVYAPHLWRLGLAAHVLYCGTIIFGVAMLSLPGVTLPWRGLIVALLGAILTLGMAKARMRSIVAFELFPEERAVLARFGARYWQLAPLVPWVMLFNFVVAGLTRRIEWRGTHYELRSLHEVRVLRREGF
jgi:cellulose synthase/poly-beta-1,6-N-acetylglucosamine synthase-like glycosyltransferase